MKNDKGKRAASNPLSVAENPCDDGNHGAEANVCGACEDDRVPQLLPSPQDFDSERREETRKTVASDHTAPVDDNKGAKPRFNNKAQCRHWVFTFNNYTENDYNQIKTSFENSPDVVSAIVAREIGESGTPHLQGYFHFKGVKRQQACFKFLGYDIPRFHLTPSDPKVHPPLKAFRYCMKDGDFYVVGRNLDENARLKSKRSKGSKSGSDEYHELTQMIKEGKIRTFEQVREQNPELAARHDEYWRDQIVTWKPKPTPKVHAYRPWQAMLCEKLEEPFNDRKVIFVVDRKGDAGKTWFMEQYCFREKKISIRLGAEKRRDLSYNFVNKVIDNGDPDVFFMNAARARGEYVSYAFLEDVKDGVIEAAKFKSKTLHVSKRPHVVVMMNEFPKKDLSQKGLSDDRYIYLVISEDGQSGKWIEGYTDPYKLETTPYEKIQETIQPRLPNKLQDKLNRAFAACFSTPEQTVKEDDIENALVSAIRSWKKNPQRPPLKL